MKKNIEQLYEDSQYNDYLVMLANKNLLEFDDYKQDVFMHLCDSSNVWEVISAKRMADKIAKRLKRRNMREYSVSIEQLGDNFPEDQPPSVLWEDNHILGVG